MHVGKNIMEDVLLDGGLGVNIVAKDLTKKIGLPFLKLAPYTLRMGDQTLTKLVGLIQNLKIHIHGILHVVTFTMMKNNVWDESYSMLLDCLGL